MGQIIRYMYSNIVVVGNLRKITLGFTCSDPFDNKLSTKHFGVKGDPNCAIKDHSIPKKNIVIFIVKV